MPEPRLLRQVRSAAGGTLLSFSAAPAGTVCSASIASRLSGRKVRGDIAMTGEVTLLGRVLPIGGVKEKVLAAYAAGITTVLMPKENERDIDKIPEEVREKMTFHFCSHVDEVLKIALVEK